MRYDRVRETMMAHDAKRRANGGALPVSETLIVCTAAIVEMLQELVVAIDGLDK